MMDIEVRYNFPVKYLFFLLHTWNFIKFKICFSFYVLKDAYAEPGQDSRNIAGLEIVVIVEDVQDVPPVFTMAPPVTRLQSGLIPGDKVILLFINLCLILFNYDYVQFRYYESMQKMVIKEFRGKFVMV